MSGRWGTEHPFEAGARSLQRNFDRAVNLVFGTVQRIEVTADRMRRRFKKFARGWTRHFRDVLIFGIGMIPI